MEGHTTLHVLRIQKKILHAVYQQLHPSSFNSKDKCGKINKSR